MGSGKITWKQTAIELQEKMNMLVLYFREYDILDHYVEWMRHKATGSPKPKNLKIDK
jgi:hypothetical protein